jgi:hypothetical protein
MAERARTLPQSAKFHALCGEVARQATFGGRKMSPKQWKILLVSAHEIVAGEDPELVRGLEGEFVSLRESTARMSAERMNSLIEYCTCWATQNGIKLTK